ncbi:long-chain-fatty-acid--CoA ligase 1 isoform X5 [Lycorma delicatula]|uniref:long-chain-fatty-acid--CoA ligase 1 isoform X5 n=1 Tax=Lycorma delicatula TaxID=130591 RepID=UPI003F519EED
MNVTQLVEDMDQYLNYVGGPVGAIALTGVAAFSAYYLASRPLPEKPLVPLHNQSTLLPGPEIVRVSKFYRESKEGKFISYITEDTQTLYETFRRGAKISNSGPCLGWREQPSKPYQWMHYNETLLRARNFGSGLVALGLPPGPQTFIGIYSQNCPEWILVEQGAYCYSMVIVPLYDTLGPDACAYIVQQAEISVVVCEDDAKCNLLIEKAPRCLRKLITIKEIRPATNQRAKNRGIEILYFEDIEKNGAVKNHPEVNGMYLVGGAVGFYSGDIRRLSDDMKALRPTVTPAVPRLLNRMYDKVNNEIGSSFIKRVLLNMALSAKENEIKRGIIRKNSFWDKLIFRKVQEGMGGRLRLMVVGSAPLAGNVLTFARCALGCLIVEGYGQTECCAPVTLTVQGDFVPEHVGPPVACCCVKLVDVPEMEYFAASNQGEVCVKGTNVFQGYYKEADATSQTIDEDGWHHTGDIGQWLPNGTLKIIDRKKHIFKLSQGEYIVPEKIESIYCRSQYVHQVFVHGESLKSCIVAIVVPEVDVIKCWALENKIPGTLSILCANPEVKKLIMDDMISWGKEGGLKSFEQVKDLYLHPDPFSIQNGLLTPTFKSKRPTLRAYFKPQIEDMYVKLE